MECSLRLQLPPLLLNLQSCTLGPCPFPVEREKTSAQRKEKKKRVGESVSCTYQAHNLFLTI